MSWDTSLDVWINRVILYNLLVSLFKKCDRLISLIRRFTTSDQKRLFAVVKVRKFNHPNKHLTLARYQ